MRQLTALLVVTLINACASVSIPDDILKRTVLIKNGQTFATVGNQNESYQVKYASLADEGNPLFQAVKSEQWHSCLKQAKQLLLRQPNDENGLSITALAHYSLGHVQKARYFTNKTLRLYPSNSLALNLTGIQRVDQAQMVHDYLEAANYFKKALKLSKVEIAAGLNLGYLYLELSNPKLAKEAFDEAATRCHNCTSALTGLGMAYNRLKMLEEAKEAFEEVLLSDRSNLIALYQLALIHIKDQEMEAAKNYLEKINLVRIPVADGLRKKISALQNKYSSYH